MRQNCYIDYKVVNLFIWKNYWTVQEYKVSMI